MNSISVFTPAFIRRQTAWYASQFSTFLRSVFSISEGNRCWCVVRASGAVREFGGCLFLDGCSADKLLEKAESEPDESGAHAPLTWCVNRGAFHNFGPPSRTTRHWFRTPLRRRGAYTRRTRLGVTRMEEGVGGGGVDADLFLWATWEERGWQKGSIGAAGRRWRHLRITGSDILPLWPYF